MGINRFIRPSVLVVAGVTLLLASCGADESAAAQPAGTEAAADAEAPFGPEAPAAAPAGIRLVDVSTALTLAADDTVTIVDVRTPAEFAEGHLEGAVLVDFSAADFREQIGALERGDTYLVYCRSGNRSAQATAVMAELGFSDVYELEGGIISWQAADAPLVS